MGKVAPGRARMGIPGRVRVGDGKVRLGFG